MTRKLSDWNIFVKKVYDEGKANDSEYEFKDALVDASKRKSEMKRSSSVSGVRTKTSKKSRSKRGRRSASASLAGGRTRRRHSRRYRR